MIAVQLPIPEVTGSPSGNFVNLYLIPLNVGMQVDSYTGDLPANAVVSRIFVSIGPEPGWALKKIHKSQKHTGFLLPLQIP